KRFYRDPATRPDLQVCVDSSAINLHFARAAKEAGIPVLYYVAPQLWASREGRMKKLRAYVDRLACIFSFEEMYFRSHGVEATFRELIRITGFQPVPDASEVARRQHGVETRDTAESTAIKRNAFDDFIPQCDLVLTKSGTSTVHVAAWGVPMIVVYYVNPLLWY